jgi:hypothetical protein
MVSKYAISQTWDHDLANVKKKAPPPPEETTYRWLRAVYRMVRKNRPPYSPQQKEKLNALERSVSTRMRSIERLIIELTAPTHVTRKMRWKYAVTLNYARSRNIKTEDLIEFIKKKGGINACVGKASSSKKAE